MAIEKYTIGGTVQETEAFEAFADIPQNRVLLAEKLTAQVPVKPEIVEGLTNAEQVFAHFQPKVDVEFETEEGGMRKDSLRFQNLGDFGVKGITAQSPFLHDLTLKREQYHKIIKQLKTNKLLKQAISDRQTKENLINVLQALIQELDSVR
jgi:predicted component of type VI protein secretion system